MYKNILYKYIGGFTDSYIEEEILLTPPEENNIIITRIKNNHIEDYINLTSPLTVDQYLKDIILKIIHCYRLSYIVRELR